MKIGLETKRLLKQPRLCQRRFSQRKQYKSVSLRQRVVTPKKISSDDLVRLRIKKPTNFKMSIDHKSWDTMNLKPNTYEYRFDSNARFIFSDASAVELSYNGQEIKKLGSEGQKKDSQ